MDALPDVKVIAKMLYQRNKYLEHPGYREIYIPPNRWQRIWISLRDFRDRARDAWGVLTGRLTVGE